MKPLLLVPLEDHAEECAHAEARGAALAYLVVGVVCLVGAFVFWPSRRKDCRLVKLVTGGGGGPRINVPADQDPAVLPGEPGAVELPN